MTIALICKLAYAFIALVVIGIFSKKDDNEDFAVIALLSLAWPVTATVYFGGKIEKYFR